MQKMKTNNVWVADFETITAETQYFKKHNKTGIVYGYVENIENPNWNYQFINIEDFLRYFTLRRCNHYIFFHNLSFDGVFILDWLGKNGYTCTETPEEEGHFSVFRTTGSKIYKIEVLFLPKGCKKPRRLIFQCSKMILSSSVKALGKNSKLEKFAEGEEEDENFYNREPENSLSEFYNKNKAYCEYCKRDVKIVISALKDFYKAIYDFLTTHGLQEYMKKIYKCITVSAISLQLQTLMLVKYGMKETEINLHKLSDRIIMDKFTNGGLTINNLTYKNMDLREVSGETIDLKSAYPAVMHGPLPYGDMLYEKPDGEYCTFQEIFYEKIEAKNHGIPLLKNWNHKGGESLYFTSQENYTTYLLKEEAETIEKLYDFQGKKIIKEYYFRLKPFLTQFIEDMFYYKEYYKSNNELGKSHTFKILLNSGYGIHAKRFDFSIVLPFNACDTITKKDVTYNICENIDLNKPDRHSYIPNNHLDAYKPEIDGDIHVTTSHKGIANYITSKTRIKLMEGMLHFGPENFVYCDTDSLFLINVDRDYIEKYCGSNLGDWEIEDKHFDSAIFIRPKLYETRKGGKIVKQGTAGIQKGKVDIQEVRKQEKTEIKNAVLIPYRVDGGIVLLPVSKIITNPQIDGPMTKEFEEWWKQRIKENKKNG